MRVMLGWWAAAVLCCLFCGAVILWRLEVGAREAAEGEMDYSYGAGIAQGCRWGDPGSTRCAAYLRGWGD